MPPLTVTSYAILGQLALRPWTTYALATELERNLHYFWPRAESLIYSETKRLAAMGYATATTEYTGKRKRTLYRITEAGREALTSWLTTPPRGVALEFEGLLRVLLAPFGRPQDTHAALQQVQADIVGLLQLSEVIAREYLEGRAPFQEHVYIRVFVWDFLTRYAQLVHDWAQQTDRLLQSWSSLPLPERRQSAVAFLAQAMQRRADMGDH
jgi:DNA-binding PadR family transcriptional regulator